MSLSRTNGIIAGCCSILLLIPVIFLSNSIVRTISAIGFLACLTGIAVAAGTSRRRVVPEEVGDDEFEPAGHSTLENAAAPLEPLKSSAVIDFGSPLDGSSDELAFPEAWTPEPDLSADTAPLDSDSTSTPVPALAMVSATAEPTIRERPDLLVAPVPKAVPPPSPEPSDAVPNAQPFRIEPTPDRAETPTAKLSPLTWIKIGETIRVHRHHLTHPLIYVSDGPSAIAEASCIDLRLPVGVKGTEPSTSLDFHPQYADLTPDQRADYLYWLANHRVGPLNDIGYAFLYFYGLERRLLIEHADLSPIVKETVRLLETYTFSGAFDGQLSRFLSYTLARVDIGTLKEKWFHAVFERTRAQRDEQHLAVGLAWLFKQSRPLPASWALRLTKLDPRAARSVVLDRLPDQFAALFHKRYHEKFGDGLLLRTSKRDRSVVYRPANPSLLDHPGLEPIRVPNILGIRTQFHPLVKIWANCIEELKPLSRKVGKGVEVETREAYDALPDKLKAETEHPDKPRWNAVATERAEDDGTVIVEVGVLAAIHGIAPRLKLTAKQSDSLAETAHAVGFVIEPDSRITNRSYTWDELVHLFRPEDQPSLPADGRYAGAALLLELGMHLAAADGQIENVEVDFITGVLESRCLLDPPDAKRLEALKRVLLRQPTSIIGIGKRIKAVFDAKLLDSIGEFAFGVATANGLIHKNEVIALRSVYRALGLDSKRLEEKLEAFRRLDKQPVAVEVETDDDGDDPGEPIPPRDRLSPATQRGRTRLDPKVIQRLIERSHEANRLIRAAVDEDPGDEEPSTPSATAVLDDPSPFPPSPAATPWPPSFEGLEKRHADLLADMTSQASWPRSDFETMVRRHRLMPSGAIDRINEWAFDRFGDPVLEEREDQVLLVGELTLPATIEMESR